VIKIGRVSACATLFFHIRNATTRTINVIPKARNCLRCPQTGAEATVAGSIRAALTNNVVVGTPTEQTLCLATCTTGRSCGPLAIRPLHAPIFVDDVFTGAEDGRVFGAIAHVSDATHIYPGIPEGPVAIGATVALKKVAATIIPGIPQGPEAIGATVALLCGAANTVI